MSMIQINKHDRYRIAPSFYSHEFFTKCLDYEKDSHILDSRLILAVQIIRDFMKCPIIITSTYRTEQCNIAAGGSLNSYHLKGKAIDFRTPGSNHVIIHELITMGYLYQQLRLLNINGFGLSRKFIHLDSRTTGALQDPTFGNYSLWFY